MLTVDKINAVRSHLPSPVFANSFGIQQKNKYTRPQAKSRHTKRIEYLNFPPSSLRRNCTTISTLRSYSNEYTTLTPCGGQEHGRTRGQVLLLALKFFVLASSCCEGLVDEGEDTSSCNRCSDENIEFLVSADGKLEMTRRDAFYTEIFGRVSCQLEHFGCEVFQDGRCVYSSFCAYPYIVLRTLFEISMDTTDRELQPSSLAPCLNCTWTRRG